MTLNGFCCTMVMCRYRLFFGPFDARNLIKVPIDGDQTNNRGHMWTFIRILLVGIKHIVGLDTIAVFTELVGVEFGLLLRLMALPLQLLF